MNLTTQCTLLAVAISLTTANGSAADANAARTGNWREPAHQTTLKNDALEACFQAGLLYSLKDLATGKSLLSIVPGELPSELLIFDVAPTNLDACTVATEASEDAIATNYRLPNGNAWRLRWSIEKSRGDLILQASARTATPVEQLRYTLFGCDIAYHALVWVTAYGTSQVMRAPWSGVQIGDPQKDSIPSAYCHPLVALFQGDQAGWLLEGRDPRVGPSNVMVKGLGDTANIGMVRRFPIPMQNPELYEIRIRAYQEHWEDAVDPLVQWMETDAGYAPIDKLPKEQAWVKNIETQAYIAVGNYQDLDRLAKRVDPQRTFVGRQAEHRFHGFDIGYPDYRLTDGAKKWVKHARDLGFHVGVHFNSNAVGAEFPDLVERFRPGFAVTGTDANGKDMYESIYGGRLIRCSPAYKPWRDYLIAQMKDAVDAGVDVIYLDESMTSTGRYVVDGVDGIQGMMSLMKETLQTYPHVAVETEQFNAMTAKYGKFALSQMPLGHPLSGYLFHRFVKVVPEGVMYSPIDAPLMDAVDCWGYMLPGADPMREETWLKIAEAYHTYDLVPDGRLPRKQITKFTSHWTGGVMPVGDAPVPSEGERLFGLRGSRGVTAYFEKHPTKRGLVVYEPGQTPKWIGARHFGIKSWNGPGVPAYFGFRQYMRDWIIYNDASLLGLDPQVTYMFDETVPRSPTRFHVTKVPEDFIGYTDMDRRIAPQEVGRDDSFFRLVFAGHGEMTMYVPDDYDVYLDGQELNVDRQTKTASAIISAALPRAGGLGYHIAMKPDGISAENTDGGRPSMLLAFKRTDVQLAGWWVDLPWQGSKDVAKAIGTGPDSFTMNVGAFGIFIGRFPAAKRICLEGSYVVSASTGAPGDGVVLINGKQSLRVPAGEPPYKSQSFRADVSAFAGQYVLVEFLSDGGVRGASANWDHPRIVVED